jgi:hypothetical protein
MMEIDKTYTATTEAALWKQLAEDINDDILEYHALLEQGHYKIMLNIDIDLGGGFEGGYATTCYSTQVTTNGFKFAIHEEHFTDEIGKFFGMQDVKTGYPDLDHHLVIKTNDDAKVKTLFADKDVRKTFDLGIRMHSVDDHDEKQPYLELNIEDGITDIDTLQQLYHAFVLVLERI